MKFNATEIKEGSSIQPQSNCYLFLAIFALTVVYILLLFHKVLVRIMNLCVAISYPDRLSDLQSTFLMLFLILSRKIQFHTI
jgi:hypothetical protein